ncbi:MAG: hypothetical protein AB7J35_02890 [Dehalococcoidia bacterium]
MVNPFLTIVFDLFLIGSALTVAASMAAEYFITREPHVGAMRRARPAHSRTHERRATRATIHRMPSTRRRAA